MGITLLSCSYLCVATIPFSLSLTFYDLSLPIQDWGITKEAAQETLDAWYRDRPEVKSWQEKTMYAARKQGWVNTVMGRCVSITFHVFIFTLCLFFHGGW